MPLSWRTSLPPSPPPSAIIAGVGWMFQRLSKPTGDPMRGAVQGTFHLTSPTWRRCSGDSSSGRAGGAALCVYHRGEPVVDLWGGARDEHGRPWQKTRSGSVTPPRRASPRRCSTSSPTAACWTTRARGALLARVRGRGQGRHHRAPGALPRGGPLRDPQDRGSRASTAGLGVHGGAAGRGGSLPPAGRGTRLPRAHVRLPRGRARAAGHGRALRRRPRRRSWRAR